MIKKVSTLSKCTRVVVLLEGKLCQQRNSSFCLTCDQAFFFRGKSFSPRLRNKREERSRDRRLRFVLIFSHPAEELRGCYRSENVVRGSLCKVTNAMKESKASPICLISLPYLNVFCTEVQWDLDITNLRVTNDFLYPNNSKIDDKEPRYNKTSSWRKHFTSPLALHYVEVPLY